MDGLPAGERYSFQSPPSRLNGIPSSKVHVIGCDIAQGLVVATPVVVLGRTRRSRLPASRECPKQSDGCVPCKSADSVQSSHWSPDDKATLRSVTSLGHFLTGAWSHRLPRSPSRTIWILSSAVESPAGPLANLFDDVCSHARAPSC